MEDLNSLQYTEQVIKESLRLYPAVPFVPRTSTEDIEINGYTIPKGCDVMFSIYSLHRNPKIYPNPDEFDPENFSPERSKESVDYFWRKIHEDYIVVADMVVTLNCAVSKIVLISIGSNMYFACYQLYGELQQTNRPGDRQTNRPEDRQTNRPEDRQTNRPGDRQTNIPEDR
uniref:Cytochrome P450 n=1 Tax=Timema douglasi TaxID=61478 RepID=A0A7R8VNJ1_TIMDO|nr:unnamed protein product [Timema douglasi]